MNQYVKFGNCKNFTEKVYFSLEIFFVVVIFIHILFFSSNSISFVITRRQENKTCLPKSLHFKKNILVLGIGKYSDPSIYIVSVWKMLYCCIPNNFFNFFPQLFSTVLRSYTNTNVWTWLWFLIWPTSPLFQRIPCLLHIFHKQSKLSIVQPSPNLFMSNFLKCLDQNS